jgi:hypothetical protein
MLLGACDSPSDAYPVRSVHGTVERVVDYPLEGHAGTLLVRREEPDLFAGTLVIIHVRASAPIRRTPGSWQDVGFAALMPGTRATFRITGYEFRSDPPQVVATRVDIDNTAAH